MRSAIASDVRLLMRAAAMALGVYEDLSEERRPPISLAEAKANLDLDRGPFANAAAVTDEAPTAAFATHAHRAPHSHTATVPQTTESEPRNA